MQSNRMTLLAGTIGLVIIGVTGIIYGYEKLAYTCVGALAGLVTGHINGART